MSFSRISSVSMPVYSSTLEPIRFSFRYTKIPRMVPSRMRSARTTARILRPVFFLSLAPSAMPSCARYFARFSGATSGSTPDIWSRTLR